METKAVIYARVSSAGDRQSTERQVRDLTEYGIRNNIEIVNVFEEHISGARKNEERQVLMQCLEFCEKGNAGLVLVSELSRLGRNVDEILAAVKRCKDNAINIYFLKAMVR